MSLGQRLVRTPTFRSMAVRNFRRYAAGALVSNVGTWMGRVGQDWLVLTQLTDHSSTALGTVTGLQFAPFVLLLPITGTIADRFPKRWTLVVTQSTMGLSALVLSLLTLTGTVQLWHVYLAALVQGIAAAIDGPTRQAFVSEVVTGDLVSNAVALNSASFNSGRIVGPGVAGLVIAAWGTGMALLANAVSFLFVVAALLWLRGEELRPSPSARGRGRVREGFAYVRRRRDLQLVLFLIFMLGTFGMNFQMTTALMATVQFHKGPTEYGLLGSIMAIGSLSAALLAARRPRARTRTLMLSLVGFTVSSALASIAPTYLWFALALIPVGLTALTAMTTANALVQLSTEAGMRGRVMALYMAIFLGGTPAGAPLIGWVGDVWGPRWTIGVGTVAVGLSLVVAAALLRWRQNMTVSFDFRARPMLRVQFELPQEAR